MTASLNKNKLVAYDTRLGVEDRVNIEPVRPQQGLKYLSQSPGRPPGQSPGQSQGREYPRFQVQVVDENI